jgi:hypothetical protein
VYEESATVTMNVFLVGVVFIKFLYERAIFWYERPRPTSVPQH